MTLNDCYVTGKSLLPRLAALCWSHRQSLIQEKDAAGAEKKRWQLVIIVLDEEIREQERKITRQMELLKFKTKGRVL